MIQHRCSAKTFWIKFPIISKCVDIASTLQLQKRYTRPCTFTQWNSIYIYSLPSAYPQTNKSKLTMPPQKVKVSPSPKGGSTADPHTRQNTMHSISGNSVGSSEYSDDSSSDEEENGCDTVERLRCGTGYCKIQRKWRWMLIIVGVFTGACVFFAIVVVIMLGASGLKWRAEDDDN